LVQTDDTPVRSSSATPSDPQAFSAFMHAYQDMVYATVARLTANAAQAEDISQEVFLRAYEHFEQLRVSPTAGGWLKTVATRLAINHLVRYRRRWRFFSELEEEGPEPAPLAEAVGNLDELFAATDAESRALRVREALARLPAHQRVPLVLFHFEDKSYQEIAAQLHVSLAKVKTDILRGRLALAKLLAPLGIGPAAPGGA